MLAAEAAEGYLAKSPLALTLRDVNVSAEEHWFYTKISLQMEAVFRLWGEQPVLVARTGYVVKNASLIRQAELLWEVGGKLPVVGDAIGRYRELLLKLKKTMTG